MKINQLLMGGCTLAYAISAAPAVGQDATVASEPVEAQAANTSSNELNDIVVTATRRSTNLQDTPIAVTAIDQGLIDRSSPRDIGDLAIFVPNFSAAKAGVGFNSASFAMRGVGQTNIIVYFEPPVAVLVDDFVLSSVQTQLLDTFDIEQIEVLRGPQGTLFGKNTTGGAVTIRTKRPDLDDLGAEVRGAFGDFGSWRTQGAVDIPLVSGQLALRLVGSYMKSDGYMRNTNACYGPIQALVPSKYDGASGCGDGRRIGGDDVFNARAKLLWEPGDNFSALLQYEILRDRSEETPTVNETPPDPSFLYHLIGVGAGTGDPLDRGGVDDRDSNYIRASEPRINVDGVYLNMDLDVGLGTLTSVSGFRRQLSRLPGSNSTIGVVAPDGESLSLLSYNREDLRKTVQQELRFASDFGGPFDVVTGAFYQRETLGFCVPLTLGFQDLVAPPTPYGAWNDNPSIICNSQRSRSMAVFAEGTYEITDGLSLTLGGRYTWDKKRWGGRQGSFVQDITGDPTATPATHPDLLSLADFDLYPNGAIEINETWNDPTWRVSLGYQATPDVFLYGTYSRGFKSGGFNDQIGFGAPFGNNLDAFRAAAAPTNPEYADSFEAGVKTEAFDRRLRLNLTGFHVTYKDLQKQIVIPLEVNGQPFVVTNFFNAAKARVQGIEAEAMVLAAEGFTLQGALGYQDGKYKEYLTPIPAGYDLSNSPLDRTPKWQWSLAANYEVPLSSFGMIGLNGSIAYTGRNLYSQSLTTEADNTYLDARTLINAAITFSDFDDRYFVRLVGKNLTDKRYRTASQTIGGLFAFSVYGPPRFFGIEAGFKLGR